jgi:hypothetical protein
LSAAWVDAFNDALQGLDLASVSTGQSLAAKDGRYRIAQIVLDPPAATERAGNAAIGMVLGVEGDHVTLQLVTTPHAPPAEERQAPSTGEREVLAAVSDADVVVVLSYGDAAALSRGELDPVKALSTGQVRVRGDLSVLVAGQALLSAAASALAGLRADTTY